MGREQSAVAGHGDEAGRRWVKDLAWGALIALLYFGAAMLGLMLIARSEGIAAIWPASGVLLGALLVTRPRAWGAVIVPAAAVLLIANLWAGNPLPSSLGLTFANLAESTIAAALVLRVLDRAPRMDVVRDVLVFVGVSVLVVDPVTGLLGAVVVHWGASVPLGDAWRTWVISDGLGMLVVAPLVVLVHGRIASGRTSTFRVRPGALLAASVLLAFTCVIFLLRPAALPAYLTRPHPIVPVMVLIALRFGVWGACASTVGVSIIAIAGVLLHRGPFEIIPGGIGENVLAAQIFLGVAAVTAAVVAAMSAERRRSEMELLHSRQNLERAQELAHIGSWTWDIETNTVAWSDEMRRIFGLDSRSVGGDLDAVVRRTIHPDDLPSVNAANAAVVRGDGSRAMEYRVVHPDGSIRHVWAVPGDQVADADGHVRRLTGLVQDVTARHDVEDRLRAYAETQRVLLGEVNHRVKNNLSAIIGLIHLEEDRAAARGQEDAVRIMRTIDLRVRSLATTHSMLSAAEWKPLRLDELCRRILAGTLALAPAGGVRFTVADADVLVDARQAHDLALVVNELATNTAKHVVRSDGVAIEIAIADAGAAIHMTYRDDGPGFPDDVLDRTSATDDKGLELVRGIVTRSLRGELDLANRDGAVATIRFPRSTGEDDHVRR